MNKYVKSFVVELDDSCSINIAIEKLDRMINKELEENSGRLKINFIGTDSFVPHTDTSPAVIYRAVIFEKTGFQLL